MTKEEALYNFWASFKIPAYEENSVPDNAEFPYITYQVSTADFGSTTYLNASVWYRSASWLNVNAKAEEISKAITRGGTIKPCDGGALWITKGEPFSLALADEKDSAIKRKILNIAVQFLTAD